MVMIDQLCLVFIANTIICSADIGGLSDTAVDLFYNEFRSENFIARSMMPFLI